nr:hypothetical protein [Tanacetum cinerariifolium]
MHALVGACLICVPRYASCKRNASGCPLQWCSASALGERKPRKGQNRIKTGQNEKRVDAGKSLKQLQWVEEEKLNKTQKEWPKMQTQLKAIQALKERRKERG